MDKDFIDKETDDFIMSLAKLIKRQEIGSFTTNKETVELIEATARVMQDILETTEGISITHELHEPFETFGSVTVKGKELVFNDTSMFTAVLRSCDVWEVYPRTDKKVQIDLAYHDVSVREDGD